MVQLAIFLYQPRIYPLMDFEQVGCCKSLYHLFAHMNLFQHMVIIIHVILSSKEILLVAEWAKSFSSQWLIEDDFW